MKSDVSSALYIRLTPNNDNLNDMVLPEDPMMLMSVINMKLRDYYSDLDALCEDMDIDRQELEAKLAQAGFEYSTENNRFW